MDIEKFDNIEQKVRFYFDGIAVKKNESTNLFKDASLPSFIRDWFLKKYSDKEGNIDINFLQSKVKEIIPNKDNWNIILERIMSGVKDVKILTKINVIPNLKDNRFEFEIPDVGISSYMTLIGSDVIDKNKNILLSGQKDIWGVISLDYVDIGVKKPDYRIRLTNFVNFKPYNVDLKKFIYLRAKFTTEEWIDIVMQAIDYNPDGFSSEKEKLMVISRLLSFVEKRLNLIELAPKSTGKSYVFSQISKYGWLNSGGVVTRAKLFYDMSTKQDGLIPNYDFVTLDEVSTIRFSNEVEIQASLKGYLENGRYTVGTKYGTSNAGLVILGNIPLETMNLSSNFIGTLPNIFSDSALLDRFHGFIEGWEISRMTESKKVKGWAVNSEYFSEICHLLRDESTYEDIVNKILIIPENSDTRDVHAIKKICVGFIKILFPNWTSLDKVDSLKFEKYCLIPAMKMRAIIKSQLGLIDKEFHQKKIPQITINI